MRILHFFKTYYPETFGGIEQVIFQLAEGTRQYGVESEVLSLSRSGDVQRKPLAHHHISTSKLNFEIASTGFSWSVFNDFRTLASQADIIHYHFPWPFMDLVHSLVRTQKPSVLTYHSDVIHQEKLLKIYKPLLDHFLKNVDHIIASSPNYLSSSQVLQNYQSKVSVIPFGLDKSTYPLPSSERLQRWRRQLGERFFLFIGVLRYYKGLHLLIEAAQGSDFPIVIAGTGPIENNIKAQAKSMGLKNIHFVGAVSEEDKAALLSLCYAIVFPSYLRSEAFGISLLEGAMFGKPMISSEIHTGTSYININEKTGIEIPPSNSLALREAMLRLWQEPELAKTMGEYAEERYRELFTIDKMARSYAELYEKIFRQKTRK